MDKSSFGFSLTNERQYIIFILILYLISKTDILFIKIGLLIVLCIHIKKLYYNYKINRRIYKGNREKVLYNLLLLLSLIIFIKNNNNYLIFVILFITTGVLFRQISNNLYQFNEVKKNCDIIFIIMLILVLILYPNYKFNYIIWMEIINHLLILREKNN